MNDRIQDDREKKMVKIGNKYYWTRIRNPVHSNATKSYLEQFVYLVVQVPALNQQLGQLVEQKCS